MRLPYLGVTHMQSQHLPAAMLFAEEFCLNTYSVPDNLLSEVRGWDVQGGTRVGV